MKMQECRLVYRQNKAKAKQAVLDDAVPTTILLVVFQGGCSWCIKLCHVYYGEYFHQLYLLGVTVALVPLMPHVYTDTFT